MTPSDPSSALLPCYSTIRAIPHPPTPFSTPLHPTHLTPHCLVCMSSPWWQDLADSDSEVEDETHYQVRTMHYIHTYRQAWLSPPTTHPHPLSAPHLPRATSTSTHAAVSPPSPPSLPPRLLAGHPGGRVLPMVRHGAGSGGHALLVRALPRLPALPAERAEEAPGQRGRGTADQVRAEAQAGGGDRGRRHGRRCAPQGQRTCLGRCRQGRRAPPSVEEDPARAPRKCML